MVGALDSILKLNAYWSLRRVVSQVEYGWAKLVLLFSKEAANTRPSTQSRAEVNLQAERLLDEYGNHILRLAYSYLHNQSDAEEVLQDTLIQFLKTAPAFESRNHEKAWMLHVAANVCKNRIQYNKLRETDELEENLVSEKRDDLRFVWEAVKALPVPYREIVHLFYYEGYSCAQIATILEMKEPTVRSNLHRGRIKLKEILKEAYDFDESIC